ETRKLDGTESHGSGGALHKHSAPADHAGDVDGAGTRDTGNAEGGALLKVDIRRQRNGLFCGDDGVLRGSAEGTIGLSAEAPDALAEPVGGNVLSEFVDGARAITVRDDARKRHAGAEGIFALFGVAGIDSRGGDVDAKFTRAGGGIRHFPYDENLPSWSLFLVPGCFHGVLLTDRS